MSIKERVESLISKVEEIKNRCGRKDEIVIEGITKGIDLDRIIEAYSAGIKVMGENRIQEAREKIPKLNLDIEWHLVGHLQRNKVKYAIKLFKMIESVDSVELAREINKRAPSKMNILVEVNTSGESQKFGVSPEGLSHLIDEILKMDKLVLKGLMTVGPYPVEEKKTRKAFSLLRELRDKIEQEFNLQLPILSMGMTEDYEYAIIEGSTLLRIGRGIFGERR